MAGLGDAERVAMRGWPVLRGTFLHSEPRRFAYWNGWDKPLLTRVTREGYWVGRGGVLVLGPLMLWWQWPERFVRWTNAGSADGRDA